MVEGVVDERAGVDAPEAGSETGTDGEDARMTSGVSTPTLPSGIEGTTGTS